MISDGCIFCKMVSGEIKTKPIFETGSILAIADINPVSQLHILIIPKKHIESVVTVGGKDKDILVEMFKAAQRLIKEKKLVAFRLVFNGGAYQHVPHLHWHLLAGRTVEWSKL